MPRLKSSRYRWPPEPSSAAPAGRGDSLRSRFLCRLPAALSLPRGIAPAFASAFTFRIALAAAVAIGGFALSLAPVVWGGGDALAQQARATAASISSSPSSGSTYRAVETVTVRLAMSEAVLVTGRPYVVLDVGGVRRRAVYAGPIGTSTGELDFDYTVQAGDFDTDGVALCGRGAGCGRIALDGGSIRAAGDGSVASLGHPALAAQSGHKVNAAPSLPAPSTACSDEIRVPADWALKPTGVSAGGTFRLLFVTSTARNASSTDIASYNRFVQGPGGGRGIRRSGGTRTASGRWAARGRWTPGTTPAPPARGGDPLAERQPGRRRLRGFLRRHVGQRDNPTNERGDARDVANVWTGSVASGTAASGMALGNVSVTLGRPRGRPLNQGNNISISSYPFYGLSQVFKVLAATEAARTTDIAIISSPAIGDAYRLGETVEVEVTYSEAVSVRGAPLVGLAVKSATERYAIEHNAPYVRGSGRRSWSSPSRCRPA